MNEQQKQPAPQSRAAGQQDQAYLNHGVQSLVAMDNPDDSQLGAGRQQTTDKQA